MSAGRLGVRVQGSDIEVRVCVKYVGSAHSQFRAAAGSGSQTSGRRLLARHRPEVQTAWHANHRDGEPGFERRAAD